MRAGAASTGEAWEGLMVKGESPIRSGKDLAGKTIAVNQVQGMNELTIARCWPARASTP